MSRRKGNEPIWPLLLVVAVIAGGLGIGNLISGGGSPAVAPATLEGGLDEPEGVRLPTPEDRIRVEVLNGSGIPGVAARATELLRASGLDVVYFGNESSFGRDSSLVLGRTRNEEASASVSRALGIGIVREEPDTTRLVDVTVLLGSDWDSVAVPIGDDAATATAERPWWDPRRLLEGGR